MHCNSFNIIESYELFNYYYYTHSFYFLKYFINSNTQRYN